MRSYTTVDAFFLSFLPPETGPGLHEVEEAKVQRRHPRPAQQSLCATRSTLSKDAEYILPVAGAMESLSGCTIWHVNSRRYRSLEQDGRRWQARFAAEFVEDLPHVARD